MAENKQESIVNQIKSSESQLKKLRAQNAKLKAQQNALEKLHKQIQAKQQGVPVQEEKVQEEKVDVEKVREIFNVYDTDKSGYIDAEELAFLVADLGEPMTSIEVESVLNELDTSKDKKIQFDEFYAWWAKPKEKSDRFAATNALLKARLKAKFLLRRLQSAQVHREIKEQLEEGPAIISLKGSIGPIVEEPKMRIRLQGMCLPDDEILSIFDKYGNSDAPLLVSLEFDLEKGLSDFQCTDIEETFVPISAMIGAMAAEFGLKQHIIKVINGDQPILRFTFFFSPSPLTSIEEEFELSAKEVFDNLDFNYNFAEDISLLFQNGARVSDIFNYSVSYRISLILKHLAVKIAEAEQNNAFRLISLFRTLEMEGSLGSDFINSLEHIYNSLPDAPEVPEHDGPSQDELVKMLADGESVDMDEDNFQDMMRQLADINVEPEVNPIAKFKQILRYMVTPEGLEEIHEHRKSSLEMLDSLSGMIPNIEKIIDIFKNYVNSPHLKLVERSGPSLSLDFDNFPLKLFLN